MKLSIAGMGCCLIDYLYNNVDFTSQEFQKYLSQKPGDGGLSPGKLVFLDEFEQFAGRNFSDIVKDMLGDRPPDSINIGGPAIVSLINTAQLLSHVPIPVHFHGVYADDETGRNILDFLRKTPVRTDNLKKTTGRSPFTNVFSDPHYNNGQGERTFVNNIGAAWNNTPETIHPSFFDADILTFGGTAVVPNIHDNLHLLLNQAKSRNKITLVNTVFDFRNEKENPDAPWPLGDSKSSFPNIDLLLMDYEEALRISGVSDLDQALHFYWEEGVGACIVTSGASDISLFSQGSLFSRLEPQTLPISSAVRDELKQGKGKQGDTTGCGDNFVGGVIASLAEQLLNKTAPGTLDLIDACSWGTVSGGFSCFYMGGTYFESTTQEKRNQIVQYYDLYKKQIGTGT